MKEQREDNSPTRHPRIGRWYWERRKIFSSDFKKRKKTVDSFLFCTDMTSKRFSDDDARTIRKLTETFGASLWDHALVVLTFANQVHLNAKEKDHTVVDLVEQ